MQLQNIQPSGANNPGTSSTIYVIDYKNVVSEPDVVKRQMADDFVLSVDSAWAIVEGTYETIGGEQQADDNFDGSFHKHKVELFIPGDNPDLADQLELMKNSRFLVIREDANGNRKLSGRLAEPMKFVYKHISPQKHVGLRGYLLTFTADCSEPEVFYTGNIVISSGNIPGYTRAALPNPGMRFIDLADFDESGLNDQYIIYYDAASSKWKVKDPSTISGIDGEDGWSPIYALEVDGARRVLKLIDWTGGTGTKPGVGDYIGATGLVSNIADAVDIRGGIGPAGDDGDDGDDGLNADMTRTSSSGIIIGTGSKSFTFDVASSNLGWLIGTRLRAAATTGNYMCGVVTAVNSTTVTIDVDHTSGSGTFSSWNISIDGDVGATGATGPDKVKILGQNAAAITLGNTTSLTLMASISVPAGTLVAGDSIEIAFLLTTNSSNGNAKTVSITVNGGTGNIFAQYTNNGNSGAVMIFYLKVTSATQIRGIKMVNNSAYGVTNSSSPVNYSVSNIASNAFTIDIYGQKPTSGSDTLILEHYVVKGIKQ